MIPMSENPAGGGHEVLTSMSDLSVFAEWVRSQSPEAVIAWDTETGSRPGTELVFEKPEVHPYSSAYVTGISLCVVEGPGAPLEPVYVPIAHERGNGVTTGLKRLARALNATQAVQVCHHSLFDWATMELSGLGYRPPDGSPRNRRRNLDTQIVAWLQDENQGLRLKEDLGWRVGEDPDAEKVWLMRCMEAPYTRITDARRAVLEAFPELGETHGKGKKLWPTAAAEHLAKQLVRKRRWGQLSVAEIAPYAARDASLTYEVAEMLCNGHEGILALAGVPGYDYPDRKFQVACLREHLVNGICYRITKRGVSASLEELEATQTLYGERAEEIREFLETWEGIKNPNSNVQVARLLYAERGLPVMGTTPKGKPATDKNALEMLQGDPVAMKILEYRKWDHAAKSYARSFGDHLRHSKDGRLHGSYSSTRTVTGRLSASGPNVMTIPRDDSLPEIRHAFYTTPPGIKRYGFDLASAELWVTASLTHDPLLTETLLAGNNLHVATMIAVFGGEPDKSRREYTLSKNVNFGIEYGAGLDQITIFAAKAGYDPRKARRVAKKMRDGHKEAYAVQHQMAKFLSNKADEVGRLPLHVPGRYRHFRGSRWVPGYTALNALVQGGVAEFMKDTMIALDKTWARNMLVLQVHDELAFDAPDEPGMEEKLRLLLQRIADQIKPPKWYPLTWAAKKWE